MSCGIAYNISACRGATASLRVHWGVHPVVSKAITGISNSPNALVTAPDHGLTDSWPVVVTNVRGMKEINWPQQDPWGAPATLCKVVDSDTLELTGVNTSDYTAYTGGGFAGGSCKISTDAIRGVWCSACRCGLSVGGTILHGAKRYTAV